MLLTASDSSSESSISANDLHVVCGPKGPDSVTILPSTISGCPTKYWFISMPFSSFPRWHQSGSHSTIRSRFCKNIISATASVPADALKVVSGRRIAPRKSARAAIYRLTDGFCLSSVPLLVIKAMIPPGRTWSSALAKKKS